MCRRTSSDGMNDAGNLTTANSDVSSQHLGKSFPLDERPSNQANTGYEVLPLPLPVNRLATPVYAALQPTATSAGDNNARAQPSASTYSDYLRPVSYIS